MANMIEGGGISHPAPSNPGGKTARAPKRRQTVAPSRPRRRSYSSAISGGAVGQRAGQSSGTRRVANRGGGGGGGGGFLSGNAAGNLAMAAPEPPIPSLDEFLGGDSTYQSQLAAINKALANYRAQMGERQDEYNVDFASRLKDLNITEQRNTADQADDYAGRGLYISGLYGKARGDLEQDFDRREGDMNMAKNQWMAGLNRDFVNFNEEQNLTRERAKSDAVNRRALRYAL